MFGFTHATVAKGVKVGGKKKLKKDRTLFEEWRFNLMWRR